MRSLKFTLAALAAIASGARRQRRPSRSRSASSWVAPVSNWALDRGWRRRISPSTSASPTRSKPIRFAGTPPMITALANGELEIANLAYSTLPLAIQNASIDDLRVISDEFQDGVDGYYSNEFTVLKDGPIKKVDDLKGKVVATNAAGSAVDIALARHAASKHGLEDKRDYTVDRGAVPDHARHADREEGRPHPVGAAVLARSRN